MKAIIHIGAEKTGTTTIQQFCARNRAKLAGQGILYPSCLGSANHTLLTAYALNDEKIDDVRLMAGVSSSTQIACFRETLEASLKTEIRNSRGVSTMLLSNEHLQSRLLVADEIERLKAFVGAFADEIRIVVYLRRQDRMAVSHYSTRLMSGDEDVDPVFPPCPVGEVLPHYFDFDQMLTRYEATFGAENISVQIFEPARLLSDDLLIDFRSRCCIAESADYIDVPPLNTSLSTLGIRFLKRFNAKVPPFVEDRINPYRQGIQGAIGQICAGTGPRVLRKEAEAFYDNFRTGNRAINQRHFPNRASPLFETNFTLYDVPEDCEDQADDLIDLAVHLWMARSHEIVELRFANSLLRFEVAAKRASNETLPSLYSPPLDGKISLHMLMRYLGALLYRLDFRRAADVSWKLLDQQATPILLLTHAFALLALGDEPAFTHLLQHPSVFPMVAQSLTTLHAAQVATCERDTWMSFFREGDILQAKLYRRCLIWLEG